MHDTHRPVNIADDAAFLDYDARCARTDAQMMAHERRFDIRLMLLGALIVGPALWVVFTKIAATVLARLV
jgi:hypothetical protein